MNRKPAIIGAAVLFLAGLLIGFIPQYLNGRSVQARLDETGQELSIARERAEMYEVSSLIGAVYLETQSKNFGVAGEYSTRFFDRVQALLAQGTDPARRDFLQQALAQRDAITAGLAQGDPAVGATVQTLYRQSLQLAGTTSR